MEFVKKWKVTANIFTYLQKKFIIPMNLNRGGHWTLSVVVHPSLIENIMNYGNYGHKGGCTFDRENPLTFILHLD